MSRASSVVRIVSVLALMSQSAPSQVNQLGIAWGFLYGYGGTKPEIFMPQARELGASFTKVYLFCNQIEPEKGHYDWAAVDAFVNQLKSPDEGLIALFSASTWAVRDPHAVLPPSPAKDPADYYRFVNALVAHCKGRVRYWQNDSEPNNPVFWAGTKEEFVAELKVFYKAVKDADPSAVVLAGGYDGLFNPPPMHPIPGQQKGLEFFDYVLKEGAQSFDAFDLRLYADPYTIPQRVVYMRDKMKSLGYEKPILCTEYGGPGFFEFVANLKYFPLVLKWSASIASSAADAGQDGVAELYRKMDTLAPQTQMFMQDCSRELQAKFERIQARDVVMRTVLALSAGVQRAMYWCFRADVTNRNDVMNLMFGKVQMMGHPIAAAYKRMARALTGVETVTRIAVPDQPAIYLFEVQRRERPPLFVVWHRRDTFSGEDQAAIPFAHEWKSRRARAVDALGENVTLTVRDGSLRLSISLTPIFVEQAGLPTHSVNFAVLAKNTP